MKEALEKKRISAEEEARCKSVFHTIPRPAQRSTTLRDCGDWLCLDVEGRVGVQELDIETACEAICAKGVVSISSLAEKWQCRHDGVPRKPSRKVKAISQSPCFRLGFCHCKRHPGGQLTMKMWGKASAVLKRWFKEKHEKEKLLGATVVLVWFGFATADDTKQRPLDMKATLIGLHYLRPWRPTFVSLVPASHDEESKLLDLGGDGRDHIQAEGAEDYITFRVEEADEQAVIHTHTLELPRIPRQEQALDCYKAAPLLQIHSFP